MQKHHFRPGENNTFVLYADLWVHTEAFSFRYLEVRGQEKFLKIAMLA